jgi:protoheme IX farnesyltransferase
VTNEAFRAYYQLVKPGVMYGNVLTAVAGFFLASAGSIDWILLITMTLGMALLVSGACVLNNYLDSDIDSKMQRTKKRPSVTGVVPALHILVYAIILTILGISILYAYTNVLTTIIGSIGFVTYVWLYGAWSKRHSIHGTAVGSISGAMPIAAGYASVSNQVDIGLVLVFLIVFFWQFPEFYSIAIYRKKEYAKAKIPVMPVVKGVPSTILQICIYTILYVGSTLLLTAYGYTGWLYFIVMSVSGVYWITLAVKGFKTKDADAWARKMFRFSMIAILLLCAMLSVGPILP